MNKLIGGLMTLLLSGCGIFGIRTAKEPEYRIVDDFGPIQIREYPPLLVAETEVRADYSESSREGFQRLAGYIFGRNQKQAEIAMTAPVIQEAQSESIAMTAPVIQQQVGPVWRMEFVLPAGYRLDNAPRPLDGSVTLRELPGRKCAVLRYSGRLTEGVIHAKARELQNWLDDTGFHRLSPPRSAAYDPPWTLPFLRRNEIHIDVE